MYKNQHLLVLLQNRMWYKTQTYRINIQWLLKLKKMEYIKIQINRFIKILKKRHWLTVTN